MIVSLTGESGLWRRQAFRNTCKELFMLGKPQGTPVRVELPFFKRFIFIYVCGGSAGGDDQGVSPEDNIGSLGIGSHRQYLDTWRWCWGQNSGLLERQAAWLTTEPSLQPHGGCYSGLIYGDGKTYPQGPYHSLGLGSGLCKEERTFSS